MGDRCTNLPDSEHYFVTTISLMPYGDIIASQQTAYELRTSVPDLKHAMVNQMK